MDLALITIACGPTNMSPRCGRGLRSRPPIAESHAIRYVAPTSDQSTLSRRTTSDVRLDPPARRRTRRRAQPRPARLPQDRDRGHGGVVGGRRLRGLRRPGERPGAPCADVDPRSGRDRVHRPAHGRVRGRARPRSHALQPGPHEHASLSGPGEAGRRPRRRLGGLGGAHLGRRAGQLRLRAPRGARLLGAAGRLRPLRVRVVDFGVQGPGAARDHRGLRGRADGRPHRRRSRRRHLRPAQGAVRGGRPGRLRRARDDRSSRLHRRPGRPDGPMDLLARPGGGGRDDGRAGRADRPRSVDRRARSGRMDGAHGRTGRGRRVQRSRPRRGHRHDGDARSLP